MEGTRRGGRQVSDSARGPTGSPPVPPGEAWAPGWYPDPWFAGQHRYWDGATWTPHVQPVPSGGWPAAPASAASPSAAPSSEAPSSEPPVSAPEAATAEAWAVPADPTPAAWSAPVADPPAGAWSVPATDPAAA